MRSSFLSCLIILCVIQRGLLPSSATAAVIQNQKTPITLSALKASGAQVTPCFIEGETSQWVLELPDGVVVNEGGILTQDGYILADTRTALGDQHGLTRPKRDLSTENSLSFKGRLAVISSPGSENWYHWLLQILPRLLILQESGVPYDRIYINNLQEKWQKDSLALVLEFLKIPVEKLLVLNGDCIIQASCLIVPSVPFIPRKGTPLPQWLKERSKDIFLFQHPHILPFYEKIYISRARAKARRITNEEALIQELEKQGFTTFYLEEISPQTQAYLFHHARVIVGPHGSGFANLIFTQPGCLVVEIDHGTTPPHSFYQKMASLMSCTYKPFYVDHTTEKNINTDMTIDIQAFLRFLSSLLI